MPTVTALRPTRREGRVSVHVDEQFVAAVGASFVVRHGLFVGLELSDDQLSVLRDDAGADRANCLAARLRRDMIEYSHPTRQAESAKPVPLLAAAGRKKRQGPPLTAFATREPSLGGAL
jgi:hypothetical protein